MAEFWLELFAIPLVLKALLFLNLKTTPKHLRLLLGTRKGKALTLLKS
jgi:hypothetical protein